MAQEAEQANRISPRPPKPGELFLPLNFWISRQVPKRAELCKNLVTNGGNVVERESLADYCLVNPAKVGSSTARCYDYQFVLDSIHINQLQTPDDYRVSTYSHQDRPVGSVVPPRKATRIPFTDEDDRILDRWIIPFRRNGGKWMGNQIYQQLAREHPNHTYQSWRDRSIRRFQDLPIEAAFEIPTVHGEEQESALDHNRPFKKRRVQEPPKVTFAEQTSGSSKPAKVVPHIELGSNLSPRPNRLETSQQNHQRHPSVDGALEGSNLSNGQRTNNVVVATGSRPTTPQSQLFGHRGAVEQSRSDAEPQDEQSVNIETDSRSAHRQNLLTRRFTRTSVDDHEFSFDEARRLYKAVPEICNTTPQRLESCWSAVAETWTGHTAEQWRKYYETEILPEYKRRNGLKSDLELEQHIKDLLSHEQDGSGPEIKREPTPDFRSPEEKQIDREATRARFEQDIALSDFSESQQNTAGEIPKSDHGETADVPIAFSAIEPQSPLGSRSGIQANEGRKRASQHTDSSQSNSQILPIDEVPITSPKKRLFGRTLTSSQSAYEPEHESRANEPNLSAQQALDAGTTINTNVVTSSSSSVPAAQKPPQSYQPPHPSATTSQQSTTYDTANQFQKQNSQLSGTGNIEIQDDVEEDPNAPRSLDIDLVGDGNPEQDDAPSETGLSDTGSEYMAFDTAPERTQLWDTVSDAQNVEDNEHKDNESEDVQWKATKIKPPTPLRSRKRSQEATADNIDSDSYSEAENEADIYETGREPKLAANVASRVETQALFLVTAENEVSEFDLPPPEGGWEALGLETLDDDDQDFETPLQTVEVLETKVMKGVISPTLSETTTSSSQLKPVQSRPSAVLARSSLSDDADKTHSETVHASTISGASSKHESMSNSARLAVRTSDNANHLHSNKTPILHNAESDKFGYQNPLQIWVAAQRKQYPDLQPLVYDRLVSTAVQATSFSKISLATALLQKLVDAFSKSEAERQERYLQSGKSFIAKKKLPEADAKALIPDNVPGFWTRTDDNALLSGTSASIRRVEAKHTRALVDERRKWLMRKFQLNEHDPGTTPVKTSASKKVATPAGNRSR